MSTYKWYWVAAIYKSELVGISRKRHLWERTVFLIQVPDTSDAAKVAKEVAQSKQHEYLNDKQELVRWVFQGIEDVQSLSDDNIKQGTEVYWKFFERIDRKEGK